MLPFIAIYLLLLESTVVRVATAQEYETIKTLQPRLTSRESKVPLSLGTKKSNTRGDGVGDAGGYKELEGFDFPNRNGDSNMPGASTVGGRIITKRSILGYMPYKQDTPMLIVPYQSLHTHLGVGGKANSAMQSNPHLLSMSPNEEYGSFYEQLVPNSIDNSWYVGPDPSLKAQKTEAAKSSPSIDQEPTHELGTDSHVPTLLGVPGNLASEEVQKDRGGCTLPPCNEVEILTDSFHKNHNRPTLKFPSLLPRVPELHFPPAPGHKNPELSPCPNNIDAEEVDIETLLPNKKFRRTSDHRPNGPYRNLRRC